MVKFLIAEFVFTQWNENLSERWWSIKTTSLSFHEEKCIVTFVDKKRKWETNILLFHNTEKDIEISFLFSLDSRYRLNLNAKRNGKMKIRL